MHPPVCQEANGTLLRSQRFPDADAVAAAEVPGFVQTGQEAKDRLSNVLEGNAVKGRLSAVQEKISGKPAPVWGGLRQAHSEGYLFVDHRSF